MNLEETQALVQGAEATAREGVDAQLVWCRARPPEERELLRQLVAALPSVGDVSPVLRAPAANGDLLASLIENGLALSDKAATLIRGVCEPAWRQEGA